MFVGISVPEKRQVTAEEGKKKVLYGARQRRNKKKGEIGEESATASNIETESQTSGPAPTQPEVWHTAVY